MPEPRKFRHLLRVTYSQCTVGNHVYYARYLDLLETARGEFFRSIGYPCNALQQQGIVFQVTECYLKYLAPARYDDELTITISLSEIRKVRLKFDCAIQRGDKPLVTGSTVLVCVTLEEKPARIPDELLAAFAPYSTDLPQNAVAAAAISSAD